MGALVEVTGPQLEPVTLEEAKLHCRIPAEDTDEDFLVYGLIIAARQWAEGYTHRHLLSQTWDWKLDEFPESPAELPVSPVQSVTFVRYVDENGATQTVQTSEYEVDASSEVARISLVLDGGEWPSLGDVPVMNAVTIRIVSGYGGSAKVARMIKTAILFHVEAHYDRDERMFETMIKAATNLLEPHVLHRIA